MENFDSSAAGISLDIIAASLLTQRSVARHFGRYGLTQAQFVVLVTLMAEGETGSTPARLAEIANVSRASMTGLVDTLKADGWVERRNHPDDRRKMVVTLTDSGQDFIKSMLPDHFARISHAFSTLKPDERETLRQLLGKLEHVFETLLEDTTP